MTCRIAAAALLSAAMASVVAPVAVEAKTKAVPRYTVSGRPGVVAAISIAPVAGGRLIADRMLGDPVLVQHERDAMVGATGLARGGCRYAAQVRPFTRLRRYGTDGRLQWTWNLAAEKLALTLLGGGDGDCLSPDGTRLLVTVFDTTRGKGLSFGDLMVMQGVIAVGRDAHGFVSPKPKNRVEEFGSPRRTGVIGWRAGAPATLEYETAADTMEPGKAATDFGIAPDRKAHR